MGASKLALFAALLAAGGCCLTAPPEGTSGTGTPAVTTGGTSTGASTTGSSTTGGDAGVPDVGCDGVYCAPDFTCNPVDGLCLCGGESCDGDCDADAGACLITCIADAGGDPFPILGTSPNAQWLPPATLMSPYLYQFPQPACGRAPFTFAASTPLDYDLFMSTAGVLGGVIQAIPDAGFSEFEVWVWDSRGNMGTQNYLLEVLVPDAGD